ncbi:hypothetical protein Clacol_004556 [Clathrus columnatus]|uniref:Uncharacterized protein n=1 Tax=Clathrus columnatus TaxID=1419009 RepID=A0AAV5AEF3_9AGAM|nr:hypothetical protein Clacol_004556 [Clathrus columnatus]
MDVYNTNQLRASETVHVITMLAGVGSLTMRISIHGMALNLLQTLYAARVEGETAGMQLRSIIDDLNSGETPDHLEKIAKILSKALVIGATSVGLKNIWKAPMDESRIRILAEIDVKNPDSQNVFRDFETEPKKNLVESVLMNAREDFCEATVVLEAHRNEERLERY